MPNWCDTTYKIHGTKEVLSEINHAISTVEIEQNKLGDVYKTVKQTLEDKKASDELRQEVLSKIEWYGGIWLSLVLQKLGFKEEVVERRHQGKENFRGYIRHYDLDDGILYIYCDTAWSESDGFRNMLNEKYGNTEGFSVLYMAEEPGCEYFWTNDPSEEGTCIVDIENEGSEYVQKANLKNVIENFLNTVFSSLEEAMDAVKKHNDKTDENGCEEHIWIHEFSLEV